MTIAEQLKETPQFKGVKLTDLDELVALMKPESYEGGRRLFQKGDVGDRLYIVVSGTIRIYTHDSDGKEFTLSMIGPGRVFGEFSILDQQPRSASATADGMLDVLTLSRDDFMTFLPEHPTVGLAMIRNLTDRLRYITTYLNKV